MTYAEFKIWRLGKFDVDTNALTCTRLFLGPEAFRLIIADLARTGVQFSGNPAAGFRLESVLIKPFSIEKEPELAPGPDFDPFWKAEYQ